MGVQSKALSEKYLELEETTVKNIKIHPFFSKIPVPAHKTINPTKRTY
jgi:hypothetical protein